MNGGAEWPRVVDRSWPDVLEDELKQLVLIAQSAKALGPPFQRVLEIAPGPPLEITLERFCGVDLGQLQRDLRAARAALPLDVWLSLAVTWLDALAAIGPGDPIAWQTVWVPSQLGIDLLGRVVLSIDGHDRVLGHWPTPRVRATGGAFAPKVPFTLSPEGARGLQVLDSSRVFTMASVLIFLLTGERGFSAESELGMLRKISAAQVSWHPEQHPQCTPELAAVLERAHRREPDQRWQTVGEFRDALLAAAPVKPASQAEVTGVVFGAGEGRIRQCFLALQQQPQSLPAAWREGGLQVMEDRLLELGRAARELPALRLPPAVPISLPKINLASALKPAWWKKLLGLKR